MWLKGKKKTKIGRIEKGITLLSRIEYRVLSFSFYSSLNCIYSLAFLLFFFPRSHSMCAESKIPRKLRESERATCSRCLIDARPRNPVRDSTEKRTAREVGGRRALLLLLVRLSIQTSRTRDSYSTQKKIENEGFERILGSRIPKNLCYEVF